MLLKNLDMYKVSTTDQAVTSFAGLPLLLGTARSLGLEEYEPAFRDNGIDAAILPKLTVEDLKDIGVTRVGDRRKLLEAVAAARRRTAIARRRTAFRGAGAGRTVIFRSRAAAADGDVLRSGRLDAAIDAL